ncbi:hypothetical protein K438DRAFT_1837120 [Mycena galopus ATCC 62051]|nr:hypothetical protein K438DRAFT_1837120 [Mycena galopus ATCC 62051]
MTILPYANRWRLLELTSLPVAFCDILHGCLPDALPDVEILSVYYNMRSPWIKPHTAQSHVSHGFRLFFAGELQTFPWSQRRRMFNTRLSPNLKGNLPAGSSSRGPLPCSTLQYLILVGRFSKSTLSTLSMVL